MHINFIVRTTNPDFYVLKKGDRNIDINYNLGDGISVDIVSEDSISTGITANELAIGFIVGIASGVPAGLVANRIYDYLMDKGQNEIVVREERITIINEDELIEYIEKVYEQSK